MFMACCYFEALFTRDVCNSSIACPSLSEAVDIRVPVGNIRDFDAIYM
jgi:hypothetical protein